MHCNHLAGHINKEMTMNSVPYVDTIFCPSSIYVLDPKKSKNIIFSLGGRENIQNDVAQPVRTPEHPKCLFQLKWPKCPWSTQGWLKVKQS